MVLFKNKNNSIRMKLNCSLVAMTHQGTDPRDSPSFNSSDPRFKNLMRTTPDSDTTALRDRYMLITTSLHSTTSILPILSTSKYRVNLYTIRLLPFRS
jgi:hypothetical protein